MSCIFAGFLVTSIFENSLYYSQHSICMQRILAVLFGTYTARWVQQDYLADYEYLDSEENYSDGNNDLSESSEQMNYYV